MSSEIPCANCKVFQKTRNRPDRAIVCEGARACGKCFIIEKLNQVKKLFDGIPMELLKVGDSYEVQSIGTRKQWIQWFIDYDRVFRTEAVLDGRTQKAQDQTSVSEADS